MTIFLVILVIVLWLLLCASCFFIFKLSIAALDSLHRAQAWEEFYEDSLEDVGSVISMLDQLMERRQMIADDPDCQNLYRVIAILHDILSTYKGAYKTNELRSTKERKES